MPRSALRRKICLSEEYVEAVKVTTERLPKSQVALSIELEPQQVQKGLEKAARKLSQQFRIPGFRPGKAPRQIVENYFGRARLLEEATDDLIQKSFPEALKQENILPVGRPQLESVEQEPFRYRVTVPVEPTVELADYSAYRLPYEPEAVTDESVEKLLDAQREQHVVLKELEEPRPAQAGDMVTVLVSSDDEDDADDADDADADEFDSTVELEDDVTIEADEDADDDDADADDDDDLTDQDELDDASALEGDADEDADDADDEDEAEGKEQQIALVEGRVRPEIYEALIGAQPDETRTVTVTYGDEEEDESLRGQSATYTLTVKNVQERLLPDWEELPTLTEFEGDIDAMRQNARERLERAAEDKARRALIDEFLNKLGEETSFEIPEAMVQERAQELFHQQVSEFQRYGIDEDQFLKLSNKTHDEAVAEFMGQAEPDVRRSLIVREVIRREGLTVNDEDFEAENERFLQDFDAERRDEVRKMLAQPNMRQMVASAALDRKLRDRLVALATGEVVAQAREERQMETDSSTPATSDLPQPAVQSDIAIGGVTENSVFDDPGPDPTSVAGTSSVEQATTADYGQQRTSSDLDEAAGSAGSNEA